MKIDQWGNRLYTGETSYDFVGRRRTWYTIAAVVVAISVLALVLRGFNLGIDFTGGAEFRVGPVAGQVDTDLAGQAVADVVEDAETQVTVIGGDTVRIRTGEVSTAQTGDIVAGLATAYDVPTESISNDFVGPSWGQDVSQRALQALLVFLVLVGGVIALYFRTWKMAVAALAALAHDIIITVGIYALIGLEVTPSTVIGFLTILGYSLYDTVVVFDKVRENTEDVLESTTTTYREAANRAVNQTLIRSINTSVVALLPVGSILFIGALLLGAGTLLDLSLALFIGIAVGTYSSIFIATPLLVQLREREGPIRAHEAQVRQRREARGLDADAQPVVAAGDDDVDYTYSRAGVGERPLGQREQPRRPPRRRR